MLWKDIIKDFDTFNKIAQQRYAEHCDQDLPDFIKLQNINVDFLDVDNLYFDQNRNLFPEDTAGVKRDVTQYMQDCNLNMYELEQESNNLYKLKEILGFEFATGYVYGQQPNNLVTNHLDMNRSLMLTFPEIADTITEHDIIRRIVFLTDWKFGQVFCFGKQACTDWKAGDVVSFPWYMPHSTANCSEDIRYLATITGVPKKSSNNSFFSKIGQWLTVGQN